MDSKDLALLVLVQQAFEGVGNLSNSTDSNTVCYSVTKIKDLLNVIIPHFNKYPLRSAKSIDYLL